MALSGSRLHGATHYEVDQPDMPIVRCPCVTCRKAHASELTTSAGVLREHFRWIAGENQFRTYLSSPETRRPFCSRCGPHFMAERPAQPHILLRVTILDHDPVQRPARHIWTSHSVPWLTDEAEVPRYSGWEPEH